MQSKANAKEDQEARTRSQTLVYLVTLDHHIVMNLDGRPLSKELSMGSRSTTSWNKAQIWPCKTSVWHWGSTDILALNPFRHPSQSKHCPILVQYSLQLVTMQYISHPNLTSEPIPPLLATRIRGNITT